MRRSVKPRTAIAMHAVAERSRASTTLSDRPLPTNLKLQRSRQILRDQILVIRLQFFDIGWNRSFGVQVVRIEQLDVFEHLAIVIVHEVLVGVLTVLRVEGVVADHVQSRFRDVVFDHVVQVLIVAPGHVHIVQATVGFVYTVGGIVAFILAIRV